MSSFSGLSALLTVSIVALVTMQMLKDNFNVVEGYDDIPYTVRDTTDYNKQDSSVKNKQVNINSQNSSKTHNENPFITGTVFSGPRIGKDANKFNATPDTYALYQAEVAAATPTVEQLNNVSSQSVHLPGPNTFMGDNHASVPGEMSGRAGNLSLCSQNFNNMAGSPLTISDSLLPAPQMKDAEGFEDCPMQNTLANQVFLTKQNGLNMSSGSLRNSNLDLRSAPPNPIAQVGPWMNSTIYPDLLRRPLEGCGPSFGLYGTGTNSVGVPKNIEP